MVKTPLAPRPILVVGTEPTEIAQLVEDLRQIGTIAVGVDASHVAIEMMRSFGFRLVIVHAGEPSDWGVSERVAAAATCPVAVVTRLLARDRRYRTTAFRSGVAACVSQPCTRTRLRELLRRLDSDPLPIELVEGAAPSPSCGRGSAIGTGKARQPFLTPSGDRGRLSTIYGIDRIPGRMSTAT
jgi:DNA-binding response OmpR family regulator